LLVQRALPDPPGISDCNKFDKELKAYFEGKAAQGNRKEETTGFESAFNASIYFSIIVSLALEFPNY
jgi:hypothetical protein